MKKTLFALTLMIVISGCMTINVHHCGDGDVDVRMEKPISASTLPVKVDAKGNTVPVMP